MSESETLISSPRGHGTAVRMKARGKQNQRSHAVPPASEQQDASERPTLAIASDHAQMLLSGAACCSQFAGRTSSAKISAQAAAPLSGAAGAGRSSQRALARNAASNGTAHPYA